MTTTETKKLELSIWYDRDFSDNPLTDWGHKVTVTYSSNRYILGNEEVSDHAEHIMELLGYGEVYQDKLYSKYGDTKELLLHLIEMMNKKGYVAMPVYVYIHSGITLSTSPFSCSWDSGLSGVIYIKKEDYKKEFQVNRVKSTVIENWLSGLLESYNDCMNGNVYGFSVIDEDGEYTDSCGGFIGYDYANNMACHINYSDYDMTIEQVIEYIKSLEVKY